MVQSYQKFIEMESVISLKLEQDKKTLDKINSAIGISFGL